MRRTLLLIALLALAIPTGVAFAGITTYNLVVTGCQESNGTYTATVTAYNDGSFWTDLHLIDENHPGPFGQCQGPVPDGWTTSVTGLSEGSQFSAFYWVFPADVRTVTLNSSLPSCGASSSGAKPLFNMWLLTGDGKYCILVSDTHPSVERQKALCFPGEDWVAEQVLCKEPLYDNDFWGCDLYGKARLHVDDLMRYHERHKLTDEEEAPPAPVVDPT